MHPYYTSTPLSFYDAGGGCSHAHPRDRRYPINHLEPYPLVGHLSRTMLRIDDVGESSQLATKEHSALGEATHMTMHGTMMAV